MNLDPKQFDNYSSLKQAYDKIKSHIEPQFSVQQEQQTLMFLANLLKTNEQMNLTSITDYDQVMELHLLDSLSVLPYLPLENNLSLVDVGTGAGLPGIPLKIARPDLNLTLLDATKKRLRFLDESLELLNLQENTQTLHGRAEEIGRRKPYRESFDLAIARAVASLDVLVEICLPLVKLNGFFVAMKGVATEEIQAAEKAIEILGGDIADIIQFKLPISDAVRSLVLIEKIKETPKKYPRNFANIKNKPL
ncbi:MAG: 16S rRNA (guanine(527)-N(7))-methyltransferase RsmG [Clostridiaceae bacterium]|nr:16S rRNA (guanine(527)-N(7))-methyltransferase RsmG [Clostridiaceae bacterium]